MVQTVFLDTTVILDYLENRHQEVRDIVAQLLLLHNKGRIMIATSIFNVAEVIDKEFEIHFAGWCLSERMSFDETAKRFREDKKLFAEVAEKNQKTIERKIRDFIFNNNIGVLTFSGDAEQYEELYNLIYRSQLRSQDALIITTAIVNRVTYVLSGDRDLVAKVAQILDAYNLKDDGHRKAFRNNVLEAI